MRSTVASASTGQSSHTPSPRAEVHPVAAARNTRRGSSLIVLILPKLTQGLAVMSADRRHPLRRSPIIRGDRPCHPSGWSDMLSARCGAGNHNSRHSENCAQVSMFQGPRGLGSDPQQFACLVSELLYLDHLAVCGRRECCSLLLEQAPTPESDISLLDRVVHRHRPSIQ